MPRLTTLQIARRYPVTAGIIAINVAIYLAMSSASLVLHRGSPMDFDITQLIRWGADFGPVTLDREWWRVFTSMWLHGGLIHVAANMWCLWYVGLLAEGMYGRARTVSVYVITGIAASLTSLLIHPTTVSVGASGAIFGVVGALIWPIYRRRKTMPSPAMNAMFKSLGKFIIYNLLIGFAVPVVDNSAHIGGLLTGVILGVAWVGMQVPEEEVPSTNMKVTAAALLICAAGLLGVQRLHRPDLLPIEAELALEKGDKAEAFNKAQEAVAQNPNDFNAHEALGEVYLASGKYVEAAQEFQVALNLNPDDSDSLAGLGKALNALKRWPEAEATLRKAVAKDKNNDEAWLNLGIAAAAQNRPDEALQIIRKSLDLNPKSARAQYTLGTLLAGRGQFKESITPLREAVKLSPGDQEYQNALKQAEAAAGGS